MLTLMRYFNHKLGKESSKAPIPLPKDKAKQQNLFKNPQFITQQTQGAKGTQPNTHRDKPQLDFSRVFSLDDETHNIMNNYFAKLAELTPFNDSTIQANMPVSSKFIYFAENEKILSKKMFYVDVQREKFTESLY